MAYLNCSTGSWRESDPKTTQHQDPIYYILWKSLGLPARGLVDIPLKMSLDRMNYINRF